MPQEVEGRDVVVVDHVLAVVCIALVQLLADPVKELLELSQGGIGGIDINPVFDHLERMCGGRAGLRDSFTFSQNSHWMSSPLCSWVTGTSSKAYKKDNCDLMQTQDSKIVS